MSCHPSGSGQVVVEDDFFFFLLLFVVFAVVFVFGFDLVFDFGVTFGLSVFFFFFLLGFVSVARTESESSEVVRPGGSGVTATAPGGMRLFLDDPRTVVVEEDEARRGVVGIIIGSGNEFVIVAAVAVVVAPPCLRRFTMEGVSAAPSTSSGLSSCWNNRTPFPRRFLDRNTLVEGLLW